jgi:hypothetical protein
VKTYEKIIKNQQPVADSGTSSPESLKRLKLWKTSRKKRPSQLSSGFRTPGVLILCWSYTHLIHILRYIWWAMGLRKSSWSGDLFHLGANQSCGSCNICIWDGQSRTQVWCFAVFIPALQVLEFFKEYLAKGAASRRRPLLMPCWAMSWSWILWQLDIDDVDVNGQAIHHHTLKTVHFPAMFDSQSIVCKCW